MKTAASGAAALLFGLFVPAAIGSPSVGPNNLVDLDHGLQFPQNKQEENAIAYDPANKIFIVGANDEIGVGLCTGATATLASPCPFTPGVSGSGFYRSTDGTTWTGGLLPATPGYVPGGDPSLDYGPKRCHGVFSWVCGTVVYYGSLGDPFPEFAGEQVLISHSDDDGSTWSTPSVATSTDKKSNFDDHDWIAVDRSSSHFGRLYVFWAVFCNSCSGNGNVKLYVAHSDDEGATFSPAVQISAANNNRAQGFRETGQIAVSSTGTVEAFWTENADSAKQQPLQVAAISTDGGNTFSGPITIAPVVDYPLTGTPFDVVDLFDRVPGMSARVDCYPHPAADPNSSRVYVVWCDFGGGHGTVQGAYSDNGTDWHLLGTVASVAGRNAFFPAAAVEGDGKLAVTFDALTTPPANNPWQTGVQVYDNYFVESSGAGFTNPLKVTSASSNPDGSSYNDLTEQFVGDYVGIAADPTSGASTAYLVWTDSRNASQCTKVDDYRNAVYAGSKTALPPNPDTDCPTGFGNTDTMFAAVAG